MGSAALVAQFLPLFLLGALFGKLMEDSGAVETIAAFMTKKRGARRAVLAVVLASASATYGGVSLFVAFFVLAPVAAGLFRASDIPRRLLPRSDRAGQFHLHHVGPAWDAGHPEHHPHALLRHHDLRRTRSRDHGLRRHDRDRAMVAAPGDGGGAPARRGLRRGPPGHGRCRRGRPLVRERAVVAHEFDPAEIHHGQEVPSPPGILPAALPLVVVVLVNSLVSFVVLPRMDADFLADPTWGRRRLDDGPLDPSRPPHRLALRTPFSALRLLTFDKPETWTESGVSPSTADLDTHGLVGRA
jgi:hypothetical protein